MFSTSYISYDHSCSPTPTKCRPAKLIMIMKERFRSLGGVILEGYNVSNICVYDDSVVSSIDLSII